ncbi:MAG TPA: hypothetical protein VH592_17700 [Gemmataceae bacterium]|jgi:hypothetical protein
MIGSASNTRRTVVCFAALAALAIVASLCSTATAQDDFTVRLSEKENELAHTGDAMWSKWLMWDTGFQRMVDRNMPYLELTNAATSPDPITQFHITIGDNRFNFAPINGNVATLGSTTPGFSLTSSTVGGAGDELVVNIGNGGLLPGQTVRFKIKLGIDPSFQAAYANQFGSSLPDYRTVLFDMNGINVYDGTTGFDTKDNSQVHVVFGADTQSLKSVWPDEIVPNGQFFNSNIRSYSQQDMVNLFTLGGAIIPEPTSFGLGMIGVAGLFLKSRSRSRRAAA